MDSFVQCHYCHKNLTNPLELVCRHSYCTDCLTKEIQNDKINCPVCSTEHTAPGASISSAKQDTLAPYLIGLSRFVSSISNIFNKCFCFREIAGLPIPLSRTIHQQQFKRNVLDARRQRIYVYVIIVKNPYVLIVEQNITKCKRKMLINQFKV